MVDKNLFLYDLAVVAIFKDEARYLKEWLDYHLLAGVEHFYLYNNDSSDDFRKVLAPYVEENLVTLIDLPGRVMQMPAYNDALEKFRFECRYLAFIDLDEFIFPKSNRSITEVVDEILSADPNAAGLSIHWQLFGSNGQKKADYSRGVLERFVTRAEKDFSNEVKTLVENGGKRYGINFSVSNGFIKSVTNPRCVKSVFNHFANYFDGHYTVDETGMQLKPTLAVYPIHAEKIVVNHYVIKSREEYNRKLMRERVDDGSKWPADFFDGYDHNEVFDDGILKYRAARAKNFSFESDEQRINRVVDSLVQTLTKNFSAESLEGELETFLTCRAVAEKFQIKIGEYSAEEFALAWIYRTLANVNPITYAEVQMFLKALPEILARPFPICKEIKRLTPENILPRLCESLKKGNGLKADDDWYVRFNWLYVQKLLRLIK
ncbi:MAG: glycosyltransferase family 92 protein [Selenomonadaceae bacterium]|nr:glycosyltransferase family 92 protein [Selenomonadaceae bacterium]MBQ9497823.1 glycosyltransferase family 92 protein [Selenomonadaceae bacterium]